MRIPTFREESQSERVVKRRVTPQRRYHDCTLHWTQLPEKGIELRLGYIDDVGPGAECLLPSEPASLF
jgi:hypothetical protein